MAKTNKSGQNEKPVIASKAMPQRSHQTARASSEDVSKVEGPSVHIPYLSTRKGLVWQKPVSGDVLEILLANFTATILTQICIDDGAEPKLLFEIECNQNGRITRFTIPASQFAGMNWVVERLGASAIIMPGSGLREHTRTAIQFLSNNIQRKEVYAHIGWRQVGDEWLYLHAGGGIGTGQRTRSVEVRLPDALSQFKLPVPPQGRELHEAIYSSLKLLDLGPSDIMFPLFSSIWRSAMESSDFSIHLCGPTGAGKSELAALIQQHWGSGLDARHLPGSWSSTANALEGLAFSAKDAILVVDDFAPGGTSNDLAKLQRDADRLLRAQGNNSGRQRMRADTGLMLPKPPRGTILSTGEDVPKGQSLKSRLLVLELPPNGVDFAILTQCQQDARTGLYAQALSGFIAWLAQNSDVHTNLRKEVIRLREETSLDGTHRRTPEIAANLLAALDTFLQFATESGALSAGRAIELRTAGRDALVRASTQQAQYQISSEPAQKFLQLISAAMASGYAHVSALDGTPPASAEAWGWRRIDTNTGGTGYKQQGGRIGWTDGDNLYLEPTASVAAAVHMAQGSGDGFSITPRTLHKRLHEKGLLASIDDARDTLTTRKCIDGIRRKVLHMRANCFAFTETNRSSHYQNFETGKSQSHDPLQSTQLGEPAQINPTHSELNGQIQLDMGSLGSSAKIEEPET